MTDKTSPPWFSAPRADRTWTPITWQGWLFLVGAMASLLVCMSLLTGLMQWGATGALLLVIFAVLARKTAAS